MAPSAPTVLLIGFGSELDQMMRDTLAMEGFQPDVRPGGADPVGYVRQSQPAAIVVYAPSDLRRYEGIPDIFAILAAADATRSIPVVAVCLTSESVELAGASRNVVAIVKAPFDLELLLQAVRRAVI